MGYRLYGSLDCARVAQKNKASMSLVSLESQRMRRAFSSKNTQYKNLEVYVYSYLGFSKKLFIISDITHSLLFDFPSFIKYIVCTILSGTDGNILRHPRESVIYRTIFVDPSSKGNFTSIQSAIDSVPSNNNKWICIYIKAGIYREAVKISHDKPFIFLKGEGKWKTYIVWDNYGSIETSATFTSDADNIIVKSITFTNSYNRPFENSINPMRTAVAAKISGDKSSFYRCGFLGLQDTLWDVKGRHYFKLCSIQGAVDFIFGSGQSIYERCTISAIAGALNGFAGYITAQSRTSPSETNGFVFKDCNIVGNGKTFLGRAWRDYARVIFYNTTMSGIVVPQGWGSWVVSSGHEYQLTFAEYKCRGAGANIAGRVKWANNLSANELTRFTSMSYIDEEGWMSRQVFNMMD
ncbi:probable pectinesterase 29 [Olea europaea var. sylvestris]|uniref:probable pectinesterase 29 n=1 Tax=Olea europaea var. sylvestris TaxID=158386 RepID=UPI000C1D4E9A|nr:probable pectinesterase 29 [Olea europaea var. sylvestris]